jgi:hypothetical protein
VFNAEARVFLGGGICLAAGCVQAWVGGVVVVWICQGRFGFRSKHEREYMNMLAIVFCHDGSMLPPLMPSPVAAAAAEAAACRLPPQS